MTPCPICKLEASDEGRAGSNHQYTCARCGSFEITFTARSYLQHVLEDSDPKRAVLSHSLRLMQRAGEWPLLTNESLARLLQHQKLPKPAEQADNLILWLGGEASGPDETVTIACESLQAIIGAQRVEGVYYIANHLQTKRLITFGRTDPAHSAPPLKFQMSFDGWREFEELGKRSVESRTAFMAMKYGEAGLNRVIDEVFRPAVASTGFSLFVLTDAPKAGLIDDRMRVEIRKSKFLIADITHENLGAYWEAGYAEGLGKPVIYTCEREVFAKGISHFDTNHHLTVLWHDDHHTVARDLKATIRATLPAESRLQD